MSDEALCRAYRHDVHKLRGRSHASGFRSYRGVPINEEVPFGADADAALLSRPHGEPTQVLANHVSPERLSLLTGEPVRQLDTSYEALDPLVMPSDAAELHAAWLTSQTAAGITESVYYPYTSLKYHTLLVAALYRWYRAGYTFDELSIVAERGDPDAAPTGELLSDRALTSDRVRAHETICWTPVMVLHLSPDKGDKRSVRLGDAPARSFADRWSQLPVHPLAVDDDRQARILDAQLRRIRSWSVALQYIEDVVYDRAGVLPPWKASNETSTGGDIA